MIAVRNHHDVVSHHEALRDLLLEIGLPNVKLGFDAWVPALDGLVGVVRECRPGANYTTRFRRS